MNHGLSAALCASVLAGCAAILGPGASPELPGAAARERDESRQVVALIDYTHIVARLLPEEQQRELNASSQMFSKDRGDYGRVRLALLLALPGTAFGDESRAASLLEPLAGAAPQSPGPLRQFAGLLYGQISERLREQRRAAQLKEQLDALKAIERKIIEREQARPR
jgi:hypothetical protein